MGDLDPTLAKVLLGGISAVAGVVVFLWRQLVVLANELRTEMSHNLTEVRRDLQECREDREALWRELAGKQKSPPA